MINTPIDPVLSFGIGLPGLATMAVIMCLLLRDPVWRDAPVDTPLTQPAVG